METKTLTLTDFLLARIAEDEEQATMGDGWNKDALMEDVAVQFWDYGETHIGYRRFLAECEAKRRLLDEHEGDHHCTRSYDSWDDNDPCPTLRILALPYADHPDYREEWRA